MSECVLPSISLPIGMDIKSIVVCAGDLPPRAPYALRFGCAVRCFNRAMRRHERHARRRGMLNVTSSLRAWRIEGAAGAEKSEQAARACAKRCTDHSLRHYRFIYGLVVDACAKLVKARQQFAEAKAEAGGNEWGGWNPVSFTFGTLNLVTPGDTAGRIDPRLEFR